MRIKSLCIIALFGLSLSCFAAYSKVTKGTKGSKQAASKEDDSEEGGLGLDRLFDEDAQAAAEKDSKKEAKEDKGKATTDDKKDTKKDGKKVTKGKAGETEAEKTEEEATDKKGEAEKGKKKSTGKKFLEGAKKVVESEQFKQLTQFGLDQISKAIDDEKEKKRLAAEDARKVSERIAEDARKKAEEAQKKADRLEEEEREARKREADLRQKEREMELELKRKKRELELESERQQLLGQKAEQAPQDADLKKQLAEAQAKLALLNEEAKKKEEASKKEAEAARKVEEEVKKKEEATKKETEKAVKAEEEAKKLEEEAKKTSVVEVNSNMSLLKKDFEPVLIDSKLIKDPSAFLARLRSFVVINIGGEPEEEAVQEVKDVYAQTVKFLENLVKAVKDGKIPLLKDKLTELEELQKLVTSADISDFIKELDNVITQHVQKKVSILYQVLFLQNVAEWMKYVWASKALGDFAEQDEKKLVVILEKIPFGKAVIKSLIDQLSKIARPVVAIPTTSSKTISDKNVKPEVKEKGLQDDLSQYLGKKDVVEE